MLADSQLWLTRTHLVSFVRPSVDLLFEPVAAGYGPRAIAVVLSGMGSDGSQGAQAISRRGGVVIAQDEVSSDFFGMPGETIRRDQVNYVLPLSEIAPTIVALVRDKQPAPKPPRREAGEDAGGRVST